jgi:hypothetical protein
MLKTSLLCDCKFVILLGIVYVANINKWQGSSEYEYILGVDD